MTTNYVGNFFISNYVLLCIAAIMIATAIQKRKEHKEISVYIILIMAVTVTLAISETLTEFFQYEIKSIIVPTILSCLNYILRPSCILLFILLSGENPRTKKFLFLLIPLAINIIIYILPLIPGCEHIVFNFHYKEDGTTIVFGGGETPFRFTSHFISFLYLAYLTYRSISFLRLKHFNQAIAILICDAVVIIAAAIETGLNTLGDIHILNHTIAISTVFYYLFLSTEKAKYDTLTRLFARSMYYADLHKMDKTITGVVQLDMNGLKYLNDTFGHEEGDKALKTISNIVISCCDNDMYPYRLGGDEFTILVDGKTKDKLEALVAKLKEGFDKTEYFCSIGYAYRDDKDLSVHDLTKKAEERMYQDKNEFYKTANFERRKFIQSPEKKD